MKPLLELFDETLESDRETLEFLEDKNDMDNIGQSSEERIKIILSYRIDIRKRLKAFDESLLILKREIGSKKPLDWNLIHNVEAIHNKHKELFGTIENIGLEEVDKNG